MGRRNSFAGVWTGLAVMIAVSACATGGSRTDAAARAPAVINVTNRNWSTIHAYLSAGGSRISLGLVNTNRTESFAVPPELMGSGHNLVFTAIPIGGSVGYVSEETLIIPGDVVDVTVQNVLSQSIVIVR